MSLKLPPTFVLHERARVGSTNDEAKALADGGAKEGALVWALEQTGGRGRRGRSWTSPVGNLYLSLVLRPEVALMQAAEVGFVAALAVRALAAWAAPQAQVLLKWPNDVLADGAKLSGILLEPARDALVLGIGVNIASAPTGTPYPAVALSKWNAALTVEDALQRLVSEFQDLYLQWKQEGFKPIRELWLSHAKGLGEHIHVRLEDQEFEAVFSGIDAHGALILGNGQRILAGDVFYQ